MDHMKNSLRRFAGLVAFGLLLTVTTQAFAQDSNSKAAELCTPDAMRLCSEFVPDAERITSCMQAKRRQLSPECLAVFKPNRKRRARASE